MKKFMILTCCTFTLTGCVGALITGQTELLDENPPDISTIPCRKEAVADRGIHRQPEAQARKKAEKELEESRESLKQKNEDLRSKYL